jgi:hypothetical protein
LVGGSRETPTPIVTLAHVKNREATIGLPAAAIVQRGRSQHMDFKSSRRRLTNIQRAEQDHAAERRAQEARAAKIARESASDTTQRNFIAREFESSIQRRNLYESGIPLHEQTRALTNLDASQRAAAVPPAARALSQPMITLSNVPTSRASTYALDQIDSRTITSFDALIEAEKVADPSIRHDTAEAMKRAAAKHPDLARARNIALSLPVGAGTVALSQPTAQGTGAISGDPIKQFDALVAKEKADDPALRTDTAEAIKRAAAKNPALAQARNVAMSLPDRERRRARDSVDGDPLRALVRARNGDTVGIAALEKRCVERQTRIALRSTALKLRRRALPTVRNALHVAVAESTPQRRRATGRLATVSLLASRDRRLDALERLAVSGSRPACESAGRSFRRDGTDTEHPRKLAL